MFSKHLKGLQIEPIGNPWPWEKNPIKWKRLTVTLVKAIFLYCIQIVASHNFSLVKKNLHLSFDVLQKFKGLLIDPIGNPWHWEKNPIK